MVILSNEQYKFLYNSYIQLMKIKQPIDDYYKTIPICNKYNKKHQGVLCVR